MNQNTFKYSEDDYIQYCKDKNLEYIGYHKEPKKGTVVHFICPVHKDKGIQEKDWSHLRTYKYGCSYCTGRGKTTEEIQKEIFNSDVLLISEYKGNEKPIMCKCKKCGNIWKALPKTLITNKAGCPVCGKKKAISGETKKHDDFVSELYEINPNIEVIGKYQSTHKKIKCRCKIDGHIWEGYPANLLNRSAGCPFCNMSIGERLLLDTLSEIGIQCKSHYSISGCKNERRLLFDAFDIENNVAFEYDGEQHFSAVDFSGHNPEYAMELFTVNRKRDDIKNTYCNEHNIPIIRIPYWERDNMKQYLIKQFKEKGLYSNLV